MKSKLEVEKTMSNKSIAKIPEPEQGLGFIDVHCHLPFPRPKKNDRLPSDEEQYRVFFEKGGKFLITSTIDMNTLKMTLHFLREHQKGFGFTCGWAPQTVTYTPERKYEKEWKEWKEYILANEETYLAIGEIGLDFHHAKTLAKREKQIEELQKIFELTEGLDKPYVLHVRNAASHELDKENPKHRFNNDDGATKEILRIMDEFSIKPETVMFHCFSGPEQYGRLLPTKGFFLSVPSSAYGFKRWRGATQHSPLGCLLTETDSYYQHPFKRGPVNVPANVQYSIAAISYTHGVSQKVVSEKTIQNAIKFFNLSLS
ncbi:MAG: putative deoxyribonuclease YcfH [Promethearchaeota archaeon]|nr:MAG: putative deoxyribonuclease YcfH [Candidatus Lokiarchaeota archaeon]